jgi:predicted kinase
MGKVIIGIGMPGSGKTTILKPLAASEGLAYINPDDIRQEVTGSPADHTKELIIWKVVYERLQIALQTGGAVVDATHAKRKDRVKIIAYCRRHGASEIGGYYIKTDTAMALKRNTGRDRQVPEAAILKMANRLELNPPDAAEGFDYIKVIKAD